jgi:uncharacterized protein with ParB-like and HNH nuclease domain
LNRPEFHWLAILHQTKFIVAKLTVEDVERWEVNGLKNDAHHFAMKADNLRISKVFSSGGDIHYVLPHFQREYTWEKENWETLLNDALAVYEEMEASEGGENPYSDVEHFLGSIVVIQDGMKSGTVASFKLVDGQQRLTTISLFLKSLAALIHGNDPALAKKIERLLVNADEQGELFFKILPTVKYGDRASYCAIIRGESPPPNSSKIPQAFKFFHAELQRRFSDGLKADKLLHVLINALQVVFITLDQKESPYRIFESLNAKGKPLTQADLVRNYVAMKLPASHQEKLFTESWSVVEELLQESRTVGRLPELTAFLRHYLAMKTGVLCDEGHVYARFRDRAEKEFPDSASFEAELRTISRFALYYDKLIRPENLPDDRIRGPMGRLNTLEVVASYPFLLRIMDEWSQGHLTVEEVRAALSILENYLVRRFLVGEPQSYLNRMFPILWNEVELAQFEQSLRTALAKRNYPANAKLFKSVESTRLYGNESARRRTSLILETINRKLSAGTGGYTVLDSSATIEHVMPQTLSKEWKDSLGVMWEQTQKDLLHTLGNLTLVTSEWNSTLSNSIFSDKKLLLGVHALRLNSDYFSRPLARWGRTEILERAEELCSQIIEIWGPLVPEQQATASDPLTPSREFAEFHFEAVEKIAGMLKVPFLRLSRARFESKDGQHRLLGSSSKVYPSVEGFDCQYWFGYMNSQKEFLSWQKQSWVAFECGSPKKVILFPQEEFEPYLKHMNVTEGRHWHVVILEAGSKFFLQLPLSQQKDEVTGRLVP